MLYLTEIGNGYVTYLISGFDFIQQVMLDARVEASRWSARGFRDNLPSKMAMARLFLGDVLDAEMNDLKGFQARQCLGVYEREFGRTLLALDIIRSVYPQIGRILQTLASRHPERRTDFCARLDEFTALMRDAEAGYERIFGDPPPEKTETFELGEGTKFGPSMA